MFFCKNEKKRKSPYVIMAITALAVVGAITITNEGKKMVKGCFCTMKEKKTSMMKKQQNMIKNMMDSVSKGE